MTIATLSAYPRSLDDLQADAREHVLQLGGVPSRNQLMRKYRIGAPKAAELRELLIAEFGPTAADHTPVSARPAEPEPEPMQEPEPVASTPATDPGPEPSLEASPAVAVIDSASLAAPDGHPATPTPTDTPTGTAERHLRVEAVKAVSAARLARMTIRAGRGDRIRRAFTPGDRAGTPPVQTTPVVPAQPVTGQPAPRRKPRRRPLVWPVLLLSLPAFVAIWSGWVELGELAGFGIVHPLPGIADDVRLNTAITLPIGVETYAAYALWVWLSGSAPRKARSFAKWSALGSLVFGGAGQIAYHLLAAAGVTAAPWQITSAVACLPVAVLGMGAALAHLMHADEDEQTV